MNKELSVLFSICFSLLDQPVHNSGSSSYSSMNRNDHLVSTTSSCESLENYKESKMQEVEEEINGKARPVSEAIQSFASYLSPPTAIIVNCKE